MSENEQSPVHLGSGEVSITLDGQPAVLKPYYAAAKTLSAKYDGIQGAMQRVMRLDMDAVIDIVTLGLGYGPNNRPPKDLAERIWRTGLTDDTGGLAERCVTYLRALSSGGRVTEDEEGAPAGRRDPPSS